MIHCMHDIREKIRMTKILGPRNKKNIIALFWEGGDCERSRLGTHVGF